MPSHVTPRIGSTDSIKLFSEKAEQLLKTENIADIIESEFPKKKEAQSEAAAYILEKLQALSEEILKKHSNDLVPVFRSLIEIYEYTTDDLNRKHPKSLPIPFDAWNIFFSGLAGLTSLGALSNVAISVESMSGRFLALGAIGLLSAIGFALGTDGEIIFVLFGSTIGSVVLGVGLTIGLVLLVWALMGNSWQLSLAKKIKKYFEEEEVIPKLTKAIDKYWSDTESSFRKGEKTVEDKWDKYLDHLREITSPIRQSEEEVKQLIQYLNELRDFFGGIPWRSIYSLGSEKVCGKNWLK